MKTKLFALILALCCLSVLLVACNAEPCETHVDEDGDLVCDVCGEAATTADTNAGTSADVDGETTAADTPAETTADTTDDTTADTTTETNAPTCDAHVDREPADEICDACGKNVVVIYQPVEPETETRVNMETVAIPGDANMKDYVDLEDMNNAFDSMSTERVELDYDYVVGPNVGVKEEDITELAETELPLEPGQEPETEVVGTRYDIIDLTTGKNILDTIVLNKLNFELPVASGVTEFNAVNDTEYPFAVSGNTIYATNVGDSAHYTDASYTLTVIRGGELTLDYYVVSEQNYDKLRVYVNGYLYGDEISGERVSGTLTLNVVEGDVVTIEYHKDSSVCASGETCEVTITAGEALGALRLPYVTIDAVDYYDDNRNEWMNAAYFLVETMTYELEDGVYTKIMERAAYTYSGKLLAKVTWSGEYDEATTSFVNKDAPTINDAWLLEDYEDSVYDAYARFTYDGTVYMINKDTGDVSNGGSVNSFVERPDFNYMTSDFGYVFYNDTLYFYDLSAWVDCVYTYDVPAYFDDWDCVFLRNGSVLLQGEVFLPDSAVSFDCYMYDEKYDLCYILIDPAKKTATEIEFGYYIEGEAWTDVAVDENAPLMLEVYPIENDYIANKAIYLAVDNNMKVIGKVADVFFESYLEIYNNQYLYREHDILDCYELLDLNGKHVTYLTYNTSFYDNCLEINGDYFVLVDGKLVSLRETLEKGLEGEIDDFYFTGRYFCVQEYLEVEVEDEFGDIQLESQYNTYVVTITDKGFELKKISSKTDTETERSMVTLYESYENFYIVAVMHAIFDEELEEWQMDLENSYFEIYNENGVKLGDTKAEGISAFNYFDHWVDQYAGEIEFSYIDESSDIQYVTYYLN